MKWLYKLLDKIRHPRTGFSPDPYDSRDYKYEEHFKTGSASNPIVDLRNKFRPPRDQLGTNACTGFASAGLIEYLISKYQKMSYREVSVVYSWYFTRLLLGEQDKNVGVFLRDTLSELYDKGFVFERNMPFSENCYVDVPSPEDITVGELTKNWFLPLTAYYSLLTTSVKDSLDNGSPVVFGLKLNDSFYGNRDGIISSEPATHGGHAMLCVGYDDVKQVYIVRNSWGHRWGDRGYCYIPYDYFDNKAYACWTIREKIL